MPGPTNFPNSFAQGLTLRGLPILQTQPGRCLWVDNSSMVQPGCVTGSNLNYGTFNRPFATLLGALNYLAGGQGNTNQQNVVSAQGNGDIIMIKPGHSETIPDAATLFMSVAAVAVIGLGQGIMRPTFRFTTAVTANVQVRAAGVSFQNCLFIANFANIASMFTAQRASVTASIAINPNNSAVGLMTVTAVGAGTLYLGANVKSANTVPGTIIQGQISGTTGSTGVYQVSIPQTVASTTITAGCDDFNLEQCEFRDTSSVLNALTIFTGSATANTNDGFRFVGNVVKSLGTTAATTAIVLSVDCDRLTISDNFGVSAVLNDTAAILAAGAAQLLSFKFSGNIWERPNTSSTGGSFISGSGNAWTGTASNNLLSQADNTAGIWISTGHGTAFGYQQNFSGITFVADTSGLINPAAA